MSSSSWISSATSVTANLFSAAAHELVIDPLQELGGAMEDALDLVVGSAEMDQTDEEQQPGGTAAKTHTAIVQRSALQDVSNAEPGKVPVPGATPRKPCSFEGGSKAPESMTFAELMGLIETELNLDATLKPKEVLSIASELLGIESLPASASDRSLKDEAIRVAQMLMPASSTESVNPATPVGVVQRQHTVAAVIESDLPGTPCCTPPAVTAAREQRRTAFLLQEVGRDRLHSAEKFLANKSCSPDRGSTHDQEDQHPLRSDELEARTEPPASQQDESSTAMAILSQPEPEPELHASPELSLMEELLLLGIGPSKPGNNSPDYSSFSADSDIFWNGNMSTALRGAILAELVLRGNLTIKKQGVVPEPTINVCSSAITGDMLLDETVHIIQSDHSGTSISSYIL
jgi:hypothetical protein